jgi:hypothetical protein
MNTFVIPQIVSLIFQRFSASFRATYDNYPQEEHGRYSKGWKILEEMIAECG